jgi:two-component system cell cycle response regulator CtrA
MDAILLDLNLPDGDGTRLARLVRENHTLFSILAISGNSGIDEKITVLDAGADGYLTKPFDRYELMANLDAIMRRTPGHSSATISVGNLVVDLSPNCAKIGETRVELTANFGSLNFLALRKGAIFSKDAFFNHLYGGINELEPKVIDVFICKLRHKLVESGTEGLSVDTVWGQGYILREPRDYQVFEKLASRHPLVVEAVPAPSNSSPV